jgi:NAD+ synthase (glutamine-hydrolysing)
MKIFLHQTGHAVSDLQKQTLELQNSLNLEMGLHIYPELFLAGYPLLDLPLQKSFILSYLKTLENFKVFWKTHAKKGHQLLFGGLKYVLGDEGLPLQIFNVIYWANSEGEVVDVYAKRLLPNYDIFDEAKYYTPGSESKILKIGNYHFGLLICEDMWVSSVHNLDPCECLYQDAQKDKIKLDGIINLSASPFFIGKTKVRHQRASSISHLFQCPFFYVNKVGGEDEILFDGASFAINGEQLMTSAAQFHPEILEISFPLENTKYKTVTLNNKKENTWESLFKPNIEIQKPLPLIKKWTDEECEEVLAALSFGLSQYAHKNGFRKFLIGLSGGIDSALVLSIVKTYLKDYEIESLYMPSQYSAPLSYELCLELCKNLKTPLSSFPIKFLHSTIKNQFQSSFKEPFVGLTDENVQSRLRGLTLYTRSNQTGAMVINTSNKSEIAVGYSTQYGDSVGAISLLGDIYKSQVYQLADYINKKFNQIIPLALIERAPTAELRENQKDQDSLPPYDRLDVMLEGFLSYRLDMEQLKFLGFDENELKKVAKLYSISEYKRKQFCPILKISSKSFGFGYRVPISKVNDFYHLSHT